VVGYRSGQPGQTVNLLAFAFEGSNPSPTTIFPQPKTGAAASKKFRKRPHIASGYAAVLSKFFENICLVLG